MYLAIIIAKAIVEVALFAFVGQAIIFIIGGHRVANNFVFQSLKTITSPMTALVRYISPKFILDRHIPIATFLFLVVVWVALTLAKIENIQLQAG